jgi:hypothetical protein
MISYCTKVHLSKCNGSWVVSAKQTVNFNIQLAAMFVFFVFDKNGLIKSCSSFEDLSVYRISWSHVDWCKFCIQIRSLNVRHFGMVEGTGLKITESRSTSMAWPPYQIPYKSTNWFKSYWGGGGDTKTEGQTDRQAGDLISFTLIFKESRIKISQRTIYDGSWHLHTHCQQNSLLCVLCTMYMKWKKDRSCLSVCPHV